MIKNVRDFPAIERLLQDSKLAETYSLVPRLVAADIVRSVLDKAREQLKANLLPISMDTLYDDIDREIRMVVRTRVVRVINATGIVVHTNLGRAPLDQSVIDTLCDRACGYDNLEFDLTTGKRGTRGAACEQLLARLAGASAACIVNNCAAALLVTLNSLANRKPVIISRGELVQIGGGFRIPDILRKSGGRLVEIGTTNITTVEDYESAINGNTGAILKVHRSNFAQSGFTGEVSAKELVQLGRAHGVPVINDLGSGALVDLKDLLGYKEPTVQQSVRWGADITCFSGDKLVGGPQAGLIVGQADLIRKIRKNPFFRALRVDKIVLAMLEHLFEVYLDGEWSSRIPLYQLLSVSESDLYSRGKAILKKSGNPPGLSLEATEAFVGGGAMPQHQIPSVGIVFGTEYRARLLLKLFRDATPPIIGRIENDQLILDLRSVTESEDRFLTKAICSVSDRA